MKHSLKTNIKVNVSECPLNLNFGLFSCCDYKPSPGLLPFLVFYHKPLPSNATLKNTYTDSNQLKKEKQKYNSGALHTSTSLSASLCRHQFHNEYGVCHCHACPCTFFFFFTQDSIHKCKYPECF